MRQKQFDRVLLLLSSASGKVCHIISININVIVDIRYTVIGDAPLDDEDLEYSESRIRNSPALVRRRASRFANELGNLLYDSDRKNRPDRIWSTQINYNGAWFYVVDRPKLIGPDCFVEHVVL